MKGCISRRNHPLRFDCEPPVRRIRWWRSRRYFWRYKKDSERCSVCPGNPVEKRKIRQTSIQTVATDFWVCRNTLSKCATVSAEIRQGDYGDLGLLEDIDR